MLWISGKDALLKWNIQVEAKLSTNQEKEVFTYTGRQVKPKAKDFKITLNGTTLKDTDFAITYPTTSLVNVDAGEATVTLVPTKTNTNFVGDNLDVKFNILPRALTYANLNGTLYAYDADGNSINWNNPQIFAYDGTAKTFGIQISSIGYQQIKKLFSVNLCNPVWWVMKPSPFLRDAQ